MLKKCANEVETSLKLFQVVSVFCFSFVSEFAMGFSVYWRMEIYKMLVR